MPLIEGAIDSHDGAAVDVLIGVSRPRREALRRVGLPVPTEVPLRLQIDSGSALTGFLPSVFASLEIQPFRDLPISTPATRPGEPCRVDQYDVTLTLDTASRTTINGVHAIATADFKPEEGVQGILGRDVLNLCLFEYDGPRRWFRLSW